MRLLTMILALTLPACSLLDIDVPLTERLHKAEVTLNAINQTLPELVNTGDLTKEDQEKLSKTITKALKVINDAQTLADLGSLTESLDKIDLTIKVLREVNTTNEQINKNIGRTIAILTLTKALNE